ncbi:metallophosphoesterase family protein [Paenibacillus hexagrammi]|uniref:Nuclease SbcCD subunit D n=1 Tax=Paenibacillus hexagrammi TaxID=2908839 RepID=A0ABY3SM98_9BACL|nr:exonuclease SbcCD subunit D C-terminal domain-containing protein [Paenibacillus sp. YPD9-1]UJF35066.1 exonuclease SbcCD subunit D C-terminal domain-containing protein [Paenibacillus sp. YPD9-1]
MRILHTADWHFGRTLEGRSRLTEQIAFMDELVDIVNDQQIDLVLIAGDVYDSVNPPAAAEQLFYEGLSRLADGGKRQVAVISGNHDHPDRLAASAPLAAQQGIRLVGLPVTDIQSIGIARTGELAKIIMLPYPSESRLKELLSDAAEEEALRSKYSERVAALISRQAEHFEAGTVNLIMSHLYVLGGMETESERPIQVGGAYTVDTSALCAGAQYTALGHLHRPQNVKAASPIRYCGSPLAYSFSEAGQAKSVTVLDLVPGQEAVPQELFLRSGKPLVNWKAKEGVSQVHQWLEEGRDSSAWIDLEVHMTEAMSMEQIQSLRKSYDGFIHIRPVYPEMEQVREAAPRSAMSMEEQFSRFYARQTGGAQPEPELVRLFLELLQENEAADQDAAG